MKLRTIVVTVLPVLGILFFLAPVSNWSALNSGLIGDIFPDELSFIWIWERLSDNLLTGSPLFDGKALYPFEESLISSETTFACAVLYRMFFWLFGTRPLAYNATIFFLFALNYLCMYIFARRFTNGYCSAIAGCIFAFSLTRLSQIGHAHMIPQFAFPLFALALVNYKRTAQPKYAFWMGTTMALQFYFSVSMGMILLVTTFPLVAMEAYRLVKHWNGRTAQHYALAVSTFALLSLPISYSYYRVSINHGWKRSVGEARPYSTNIKSFLVVPEAHRYASMFAPLIRYQEGARHEKCFFVGFSVFLLAWIGFLRLRKVGRRNPKTFYWRRILSFTWIFVVLFSWGTNAGLYNLFFWLVPGMSGIRVPARFAFAYLFLMSILAALGTRSLWANLRRRHKSGLATVTFALLALAFYFDTQWNIPVVRTPDVHSGTTAYLKQVPNQYPVAYVYQGIHDAEATYMYYSLEHDHPILNGYSGFMPESTQKLREALSQFLATGASHFLKPLADEGVRYIALDRSRLPDGVAATYAKHLALTGQQVSEDAQMTLFLLP